jgi:hypothetical protein
VVRGGRGGLSRRWVWGPLLGPQWVEPWKGAQGGESPPEALGVWGITDIYLSDNFEPTTPFLSDQKKLTSSLNWCLVPRNQSEWNNLWTTEQYIKNQPPVVIYQLKNAHLALNNNHSSLTRGSRSKVITTTNRQNRFLEFTRKVTHLWQLKFYICQPVAYPYELLQGDC